jgi:adenylate cyclase
MRVPVRLSPQSPWRKAIAAAVIAAICATFLMLIGRVVTDPATPDHPDRRLFDAPNNVFYDQFFKFRPIEDRAASRTVIVAIDEKSLKDITERLNFGWPWPRDIYAHILAYLQKAGARCVAIDLLFSDTSYYAGELDDDTQFAAALDSATIPVVLATAVEPSGKPGRFTPPIKKPALFGAINGLVDATVRDYPPVWQNYPSLAMQAVKNAPAKAPDWAYDRFRLQFYGPHRDQKGKFTFRYVPASNVLADEIDPGHDHGISPSLFKDKIVLIGATAVGTYDLKSSPTDQVYPGVEVHATAIENLLFRQRVQPIRTAGVAATAALASLAAASGSIFLRRVWLKMLVGIGMLLLVFGLSLGLFLRADIRWLEPMAPLSAVLLSIMLALGWSYFIEDRQSRFLLKALSQSLSPAVVDELRRDPSLLEISTRTRELTILFSDIAGFTDLSEELKERIGPLLNYYLDQMSTPVFDVNGTLDKYIGDAVMCFWNAPLLQPDHAALACRTALAMMRRLEEIQPELAKLGGPGLACRIGINTGVVTYGMMGSTYKVSYSVIGDAVNFASRLEGANKFYDSGIMLGESTADIVRSQFTLRKLDLLRVKGKKEPAGVYQLLSEGAPSPAIAGLVDRYEDALTKYQAQDWNAAEQILLDVLREFPDDGPTKVMLERVQAFREDPPGPDWDGVYVAKTK